MVAASAASSAAGTGAVRKRKTVQVSLAYYTVIPQLLNYQK
jgi:hypothetical protein